tara:strand:- start:544 stop:966 length:423 start_codon:yes stop_codon:yes gene_type:complete
MNHKRVMGVDFGEVKIGIALSDPLKIISSPYLTINRKKTPDYISEIKKIVLEKEVESIVVGYPLTLSGNKSKQTQNTEKFINQLEIDLDTMIFKCDERLSSQEAERYMKEQGVKIGYNKEKVDQISASIILNQFLLSYKK